MKNQGKSLLQKISTPPVLKPNTAIDRMLGEHLKRLLEKVSNDLKEDPNKQSN